MCDTCLHPKNERGVKVFNSYPPSNQTKEQAISRIIEFMYVNDGMFPTKNEFRAMLSESIRQNINAIDTNANIK